MKIKILIISLIIFLIILGGIFGTEIFLNSNKCEIKETRETPVSIDLAKSVAIDQVHKNNPPFNWSYVGHYIVYNSFGEKNYYVFIFRKSDFTKFDTLNELEQNAKLFVDSPSKEYNQLNDEEKQFNLEQKYQFTNIATVITGAMKEDELIQRHFRGIPEPIGKKLEIEEKFGKVSNLIADSPSGGIYYEIEGNKVVSVNDFSVSSLSELKENRKDIQKRKYTMYSTFENKECKNFQEASIEAEQAHIAKWNNFNYNFYYLN